MTNSPRALRRLRLVPTAFVLLVVVGVGALAFTRNVGSETPGPSFTQFSNRGTVLAKLPGDATQILRRIGSVQTTTYLGDRNGRAFYRILRDNAPACYGSGSTESIGSFGSIACPTSRFPSVEQPFLDVSLFDVSERQTSPQAVRIEGFAADAVRMIKVIGADGKLVARVSVVGNIYSATSVAGEPIGAIVAVDRAGREIVGRDLRRGS
jgi:hypothetical protein